MSTRDNKETIRRLTNKVNSGDLSGLEELCSNDFVYRSSAGEEYHGIDGFKELVNTYRSAISDFEISLEEIVAEGDKVFDHYRVTGTHTGELMGIPGSNNEVNLLISSLTSFKNGKMVEQFDNYDLLTFLKQLGAVSQEVHPEGKDWPTGGSQLRPQN